MPQKEMRIIPKPPANAVVLEKTKPAAEEASELTEGLKSLGEDEWKKKNVYD